MPKREFKSPPPRPLTGLIWDIKKYSIHDGPGIRTTVFFKGCPLRCPWCCNPEAQGSEPEILHLKENCVRCNRCLALCPTRAISVDKRGTRRISWSRCNTCGLCATHCPNQALNIVGKRMTAPEVLGVVRRDAVFYERSGGGLTLTGGEPLAQPDFVYETPPPIQDRRARRTRGDRDLRLCPMAQAASHPGVFRPGSLRYQAHGCSKAPWIDGRGQSAHSSKR